MSDDTPYAPTLVRDIAAWLGEVELDDNRVTAAALPRSTIIPTLDRPHSADAQARALVEQLGAPDVAAALVTGETLGEGGMGIVRLAEQVALGRTVAVKSLRPGRRDPDGALALLREAWVTGALEHPSIVPVHTIETDEDGLPMIVLKRIEGADWSYLLDDAAAVSARFGATDLLTWNLEILLAVLNAVRFAHSRGVLHRDLKPSNVRIGEFGEVYLLDWGLAVSTGDDRGGRLPRAEHATAMAGTPVYMAPEMLGPEHGGPLTVRTDVYLAGAVLYELVTGAPPHDAATATAIIANILESSPPMPASVPAELARICARAMAAAPADRYATIDELQRELQAFVKNRGAARLTEVADGRLRELVAEVARTEGDLAGRRERVHGLLGACRFGFHEALVAWPENEPARAGVVRATVAVAEFELAAGDPQAAVTLLSELDLPPADVLGRARDALAAAARRQAILEEVGRRHNPAIGRQTRRVVAGILGVLFTLFSLSIALFPDRMPFLTYPGEVLVSAGLLSIVAVLVTWARESLMKTWINRRAVAFALLLFLSQATLYAACWRFGVAMAAAETLMMLVWTMTVASLVIAIDLGLWPSLAGNIGALAVALAWPDARHFAMASSNAIFTINVVIRWRTPTAARPAASGS